MITAKYVSKKQFPFCGTRNQPLVWIAAFSTNNFLQGTDSVNQEHKVLDVINCHKLTLMKNIFTYINTSYCVLAFHYHKIARDSINF